MPRTRTAVFIVPLALLATAPALADEIGFEELVARLGGAVPTGSNVTVSHVEAPEATGGYGPDTTQGYFAGKTFSMMNGTLAASAHATEVGRNWYGIGGNSIAPGLTRIWVYNANGWAQGSFLRVAQGAIAPLAMPASNNKIVNCSWIGAFGAPYDNEAIRRADFAMNRDGTLFVVGQNNGAGSASYPLMSGAYNGLAVGLSTGQHSVGVPVGTDGAARMKPEIVAPGSFTSFATPVVSAAAALLYDVAYTLPFSQNVNRLASTTVKAALMAGAVHGPAWTNQAPSSGASRGITAKPIDPVFGAGTVNIDRAHRIFTANEGFGASTSAGATTAQSLVGWDFEVATLGYARWYRIDVPNTADASILLTWNRNPTIAQFSAGTEPGMPDLRLELFRISIASGSPVAISGDAGAATFAAGNCVSDSAQDNFEHLYLKGLAAGSYLLAVTRNDAVNIASSATLAWMVEPQAILGDLNGDWLVNGADLGIMLGNWGLPGITDLDNNGTTNGADLGILLGAWR
jgi:hypothetical protein